jgi:hypothetical protein
MGESIGMLQKDREKKEGKNLSSRALNAEMGESIGVLRTVVDPTD